MADNPSINDPGLNAENMSFRSRASSVISTGTKFSISTLPIENHHIDGVLHGQLSQEHPHIDGVLNGHASRISARPASMYSYRSAEHPLPAYEDSQGQLPIQPATTTSVEDPNHHHHHPPTPSSTDPENALSMHYGRVVRTIDENHAHQVSRLNQTHAQEIAAIRHAIDHAYRKELKAKDREVERIREEAAAHVAALEAEIQSLKVGYDDAVERMRQARAEEIVSLREGYERAIVKARNAVEDLWEGRWNDRTRLAAEEGQRCEVEWLRKVGEAVAERDGEWFGVLGDRYPQLAEELKSVMDLQSKGGDG